MIKKSKTISTEKSIKKRLVVNFMLVILISVAAFEALLISFTKYYFYNNIEGLLTNQIKISSDFYSRYFSNVPLEANVIDNVDIFWKQTKAQVQIISPSGELLMDSIGIAEQHNARGIDFIEAIKGNKGRWIGRLNEDKVIIISYPLKSDDRIVGVLRFISSLREVDKTIRKISLIFISIGAVVVVIAGVVSVFLAHSIIYPLKEVKMAAVEMAGGNLKIRIEKKQDDEIGRLADTLNYMAEEIEKREQIKNEFISSVSHELRTPLTAIRGWAITLNDGILEDKAVLQDGLNIIEKESDRLTSMVEELLDFSRLISGKITLNKRKINIKNIMEYITLYMEPRAQREGINFKAEWEENMSDIEADIDRIKQVLINLLDNAFKFTPSGGTVELKANKEKDFIIISVTDNGCGISAEDIPRIKEKFYKGKNSKSQTGLGLSICDEIIKIHEGELIIQSKVNEGTKVTIKLPLKLNKSGENQYEKI